MANVKNAPAGRYFVEHGYSQSYPWVVVDSSPSGKTLTVAAVDVEKDPEWVSKMKWYAGGFCGHLANQEEQTWIFKSVCPMRKRTIRLTKKGWAGGSFSESPNGPQYYYDYNF